MVQLDELMATRRSSIDPSKFPDEAFELYSIPAFDARKPELLTGSAIGSTKQVVRPQDVLLSKIVPHIRRSWIVGSPGDSRQIASGEWIVFRSDRVVPAYLRHALVCDNFHTQFMRTVSGVGGSLLRARPAQVGKIQVPLPPLPEQRRIAAILDQADALRVKRREALAQLDSLTQSVFVEMFGEPMANPKGWQRVPLGQLMADGPQNGLYKPASDYGSGTPIVRIDAFYDGVVTGLAKLKRVQLSDSEASKYALHENDIVINRVNSPDYLGKSALIPALAEPTVFESNMMRFSVKPELATARYLVAFLQTGFIKAQIRTASKDAVNQSSINQQDVQSFLVNLPPLSLQIDFVARLDEVDRLRKAYDASADALDQLFASLQHRAFRGEL